jgi:transposase-like protein
MAKRRVGRYPRAFRQMAVDRLRKCDNVVALSEELGVHRRLLYKWRQQLEPTEPGGDSPPDLREFTLGKEISQLKRLLAEKVQEVDFSRVPCKESRLDTGTANALARRHLWPSPGSNAHARQVEC